jgi:cystathionine beta-synthase
MFNDDWMRERGFLEEIKKSRRCDKRSYRQALIVARTEELVSHAIEVAHDKKSHKDTDNFL